MVVLNLTIIDLLENPVNSNPRREWKKINIQFSEALDREKNSIRFDSKSLKYLRYDQNEILLDNGFFSPGIAP